ncbi:CBS domain-containing protein [Paraburkholderia guartelaensis]|uniref:CBS domain-containing protein n=1 Tax=Paraburkholderia guartelaensis TaxID=2546446 RepID=UPI002AB68D75|nr:CBS domain-containing protein [Paraburkholderia guartelaensis]
MRALDIMTESVVTATPEMTIHDAATLFVDNHIGGLPVIDATGKVVGIVSHSDLLNRIENGTNRSKRALWLDILFSSPREQAAKYVREHGHVAGDVMWKKRAIRIAAERVAASSASRPTWNFPA